MDRHQTPAPTAPPPPPHDTSPPTPQPTAGPDPATPNTRADGAAPTAGAEGAPANAGADGTPPAGAGVDLSLPTDRWLPTLPGREVTSAGPPGLLDARQAGLHRLAVAVALQRAGPGAVASHWSAAVLHGLPAPRAPELEVSLTVAAGHRPCRDGIRSHPDGPLAERHLTDVDGLPATSVARTVVDVAGQAPLPEAVVLADAAIHVGQTSHDELRRVLADRVGWPGARRAAAVVDLASDRAASVLESHARVLLVHELALPPPLLNPCIFDATGRAIAQVAMLWPQWHTIAEPVDGGNSYRPAGGATPFLRRFRARQLRSLGYRVVHWTWWDLTHHPDRLAERIRPLPSPWRKEVS